MKNKKIFYILGIVILIILTIGAFFIKDNYSYLKLRLNKGAFMYTNTSDVLPQDRKISSDYYMHSFLRYEFESKYHYPEDKIFCVSTKKAPVYIKLTSEVKIGVNTFLVSRFATVCGNQYIIDETWPYGPQLYGVFDLK